LLFQQNRPAKVIYVLSVKPEHRTTQRQHQVQLAVSDAAVISSEPGAITDMVYVSPDGSSAGKRMFNGCIANPVLSDTATGHGEQEPIWRRKDSVKAANFQWWAFDYLLMSMPKIRLHPC
jgi:hypothetical protein